MRIVHIGKAAPGRDKQEWSRARGPSCHGHISSFFLRSLPLSPSDEPDPDNTLQSVVKPMTFYLCYLVTSATWAFKSALSGVLCQRLSENPDERCCEPRYCQIYILHLHSVWQFYLSGIFLSSFDLPLPPWPWDQTTGDTSVFDTEHPRLCLRHVWITVHCMIISAALVRRSSWKLLLSGSEVGGGELRMRKRDQGAPAMLKFHNRTMRMRTLIRTTRSSTLASSRLPGRKLH